MLLVDEDWSENNKHFFPACRLFIWDWSLNSRLGKPLPFPNTLETSLFCSSFHCINWPPSSSFHSFSHSIMRAHTHLCPDSDWIPPVFSSCVRAFPLDTHQRKVNEQTGRRPSYLVCKLSLALLSLSAEHSQTCNHGQVHQASSSVFLNAWRCGPSKNVEINQVCLRNWKNAGSDWPVNSSFHFLFLVWMCVNLCKWHFHIMHTFILHILCSLTHCCIWCMFTHTHAHTRWTPSDPFTPYSVTHMPINTHTHTHTHTASCHCAALRSLEEVSRAGMWMGRMCSRYRCCFRHALSTINHPGADAALTWILK